MLNATILLGDWFLHSLLHGTGFFGVVHQAITMLLGVFFFCSGANKLWCGPRHRQFCRVLAHCKVPYLRVMRWVVAGTVFGAGSMLILGLAVPVAAGALIVVLLWALVTDGFKRVETLPKCRVVNRMDYVAWQLYLPEVWYIVALLVPLSLGAPALSMDRLFLGIGG